MSLSSESVCALVPRVLFDGWSEADFKALFSSEREQDLCSQTLIHFLQV